MKRLLIFLITACTLIASCSKEQGGTGPGFTALETDKTSLSFAAEGGEQTLTVTASEKVFAVPGENWFSASTASGGTGKTVVTVKASANDSASGRTSRLAIVAGDEQKYVDIIQAAPSDNAAWAAARRLGAGWNLGNQMDAFANEKSDETCWGNPRTDQPLFDALKKAGFASVRIPVTWMGHIDDSDGYKIEEAWLDRVAEIVGYAEKAGLNAIVNIHHDGADSEHWLDIKSAAADDSVNSAIIEKLTAVWKQIAERFADKGDFLIFESLNEIHDGGWGWGANLTDGGRQYACLNEWNQAFVDAVRSAGGNNASRYLGVPGYSANPGYTMDYLKLPKDTVADRLMVAVHCYDPYDYTLDAKYGEWGHTAKAASIGSEKEIEDLFKKLFNKYVAAGIPVYLGETGCVNRATEREQAFQRYYLEYVCKAARTYGMAPFIWDNGAKGAGNECHAFFDHATGEYCSPEARAAMETVIKAVNTEDEDYTLATVYANAPK